MKNCISFYVDNNCNRIYTPKLRTLVQMALALSLFIAVGLCAPFDSSWFP